jgi:hypothetical protein
MQIVNYSLVKHPMNWFTVVFMLLLAAMLGTLAMQGLGFMPASSNS